METDLTAGPKERVLDGFALWRNGEAYYRATDTERR